MKLCEKIKEARTKAGLKQDEFANCLLYTSDAADD